MRLILLSVFFISASAIYAQELILNGGFEDYSICPDAMSEFERVENWFSPTAASPDYLNICDLTGEVSIPNNYLGYQPAQSGDAYAGIYIAQTGGALYREYIEIPITENLLAGYPYTFSFYINLADLSTCQPNMICAYISKKMFWDPYTTGFLSQNADLLQLLCSESDENISDTAGWKKLSFCFIATGDEKFITIGNSYTNIYAPCYSEEPGLYSAYVFIDNVSLVPFGVQTSDFDTTVCKNSPVQLDAALLIDEPVNTDPVFVWDDGYTGPHRTLYRDGEFEVYVYNGCGTDTVYITINYDETCPEIFYIPNAFSPNNDGTNDRFRITEENITVENFCIFNRWGMIVFNSSNAVEGWDGTTNNIAQPEGVYLYFLDYTTNISSRSIHKTGYITLMR